MQDREFQNPELWCRGSDFWMLNDELEEEELCRQLRTMKEQGVGSVIVRTYMGLRSDYPGRDFMKKMHAVVAEAGKTGLKLLMQAGYMPEAVLDLPEEYSIGNLCCFPRGKGEGILMDSYEETDYCVVPSGRILDMLNRDACRFYVKQSYEDFWKEFREEFGQTIISVWVDEPSFRKVSMPWTGELPDAYEQLWKEPFPYDSIHLLFTEGKGAALFRLRYWRTILHLMKHAYFQSVRDWCTENHLLFSGHLMEEDSMERQIRATCFTMPMYQYFDLPGIDYLTAQMEWHYGEIKPEKYYNYGWTHFASYNTPLQCSSAAHQTGKHAILAEIYGVSTENLNFRDQKYLFDRFAVMGINHRSVHGMFYSLRGRGKRAYPPHINDYQPYWPQYHLVTDAIARESAFLRAGKAVKDVVVLHPMETAFSLYQGNGMQGEADNPALKRLDQRLNELLRHLTAMQINFELGDEDTIAERGSITAEGFQIGEMTYQTVVVPNMEWIRSSTLQLLLEFHQKGGNVIVLGAGPSMTDLGEDCTQAWETMLHADSLRKLEGCLKTIPASYRFIKKNADTSVQILFRRDGEALLFFLMNTDCRYPAAGRLCLEGTYKCRRFFETDGSVEEYPVETEGSSTQAEVTLLEGSSMMLKFTKEKNTGIVREKETYRYTTELKEEWQLQREDPNVLVLEMFRFAREGEALSTEDMPVIAIQSILQEEGYEGWVMLETAFELEQELEGLSLAVEHPKQLWLEVDGTMLDNTPSGSYRTFGFEKIKLGTLAAGVHRLRIRRLFLPLKKAKMAVTSLFENLGGTELEPVLLLGDFAVRSVLEPSQGGCIRMNRDFVLGPEERVCGGELVSHGYPFYCGVMTMSAKVCIPEQMKEVRLMLQGLWAATAEVRVNDIFCGNLCWGPYSVSLKGWHPGENTITIKLYGTMRNLLGPWHRPVGEVGACWSGYESPNLPWEGRFALENGQISSDWYLDRVPDRPGWTESYLLLPMGIIGAMLVAQ